MRGPLTRTAAALGLAVVAATVAAAAGAANPASSQPRAAEATSTLPHVGHIWTILLENEDEAESGAEDVLGGSPYLYTKLRPQGAWVVNYFGTGHSSLDNYIAMVSGQGPTDSTQDDCNDDTVIGGDFDHAHFNADGQALGTPAAIAAGKAGCVYPADVPTLVDQLKAKGLTWRGYMEDVDAEPTKLRVTCQAARWQHNLNAAPGAKTKSPDDYKRKHDPFVYFHSITGLAPASGAPSKDCDENEVAFPQLYTDLQKAPAQVPNYSFVTPNQCDDGHDDPCSDGRPGGVAQIDKWLPAVVDHITASAAYKQDGLLIVTWDEGSEAFACCNEVTSPNLKPGNDNGGVSGFSTGAIPATRGGGQVGAVLLSPFINPGTVTNECYNHYSYLRSMEDLFRIGSTAAIPGSDGKGHIGYAGHAGLSVGGVAVPCMQNVSFGADVFTNPDGGVPAQPAGTAGTTGATTKPASNRHPSRTLPAVTPPTVTSPRGGLAATGLRVGIPLAALALLGAGAALHRRRHAR